jgi:TRAP transporter TAXI family solute receptor
MEETEMKRKNLIRGKGLFCMEALMVITLLALFIGTTGWTEEAKPYTLPKTIYWGYRFVGASISAVAVTTAEQVGPELGTKIRMVPGEDVEIINMLLAGRIHLATFSADNYWASMGLVNYSAFSIGPVPLRLIWPGALYAGSTGLATKASGIKTPYDLKGKRVARIAGTAWSDMGNRAQLAFGNLTNKDVIIVDFSSGAATYKALAEGKADYKTGVLDAPGAHEIAASPYGLTLVRFPHEDKEGWARMRKIVPYFLPGWTTEGLTIKPGEKVPTICYPWPLLSTLASQSEEFVYTICKAIYKRMDKIIAAYGPNRAMRPDLAVYPEVTIMAPFHPGAVKFFKEIGMWTTEMEAANNKQLAHLEKVNKRWEAFVSEAEERMKKTGKKVDPIKEWPAIVEKEIGLAP